MFVGAKAAGEPLFRYDFDRSKVDSLPKAHLQLHAHRDALAYVMAMSGKSTSKGKHRVHQVEGGGRSGFSKMSELHFPMGGDRFRPALEDVLDMLINELGVDCEQGWKLALRDGRRTWREVQARAVVRDSPELAARVLESLGYTVHPPADGHAVGNPARLLEP